MNEFENELQPPERFVRPPRVARLWATGRLLGSRLILAHTMDEIFHAAFPHYDPTAPAGERRTARQKMAVRTAEYRQKMVVAEWESGVGARVKHRLVDTDFEVEKAVLAPKSEALTRIPGEWPEGLPLVLCRHLYPGAEFEGEGWPGPVIEWHDARTPTLLLKSWSEAGMIVTGRL